MGKDIFMALEKHIVFKTLEKHIVFKMLEKHIVFKRGQGYDWILARGYIWPTGSLIIDYLEAIGLKEEQVELSMGKSIPWGSIIPDNGSMGLEKEATYSTYLR